MNFFSYKSIAMFLMMVVGLLGLACAPVVSIRYESAWGLVTAGILALLSAGMFVLGVALFTRRSCRWIVRRLEMYLRRAEHGRSQAIKEGFRSLGREYSANISGTSGADAGSLLTKLSSMERRMVSALDTFALDSANERLEALNSGCERAERRAEADDSVIPQ